MKTKLAVIILFCSVIFTSCSQEQKKSAVKTSVSEIDYGTDICAFSEDTIETVRYGGKIELNDGTFLKFMSAECVAGYYIRLKDKQKIKRMEIVDFADGKKMLPVNELVYLNSPLRPSPNGMNLTAVDASNKKMRDYIYDAYPGDYLTWQDVLAKVENEWNIRSHEITPVNTIEEDR